METGLAYAGEMMTHHGEAMKLWILQPRQDLPDEDHPWCDWDWDQIRGFIVRALSESEARRCADDQAGYENIALDPDAGMVERHSWLDPAYSTCAELLPEGEPGIVMRSLTVESQKRDRE